MTLTDYIKSDIQKHIDCGLPVPCNLTIAALSEHYRVSLTPVRAAIDQLLNDRYLVKRENGRLGVREGKRKPSRAKKSINTSHKPINLEEVIRHDVIRASLCGSNEFLREEGTAKKYSVGRTALRPILNRLSGQGFLNYVPRCGWQIRRLDQCDLQAYLECREALELKALELAGPRLKRAELEALLAGNRAPRANQTAVFDNSLHAYWIKLSGNSYIQTFFNTHGKFYGTLLEYLAPEASVVEEVARQHCGILEALIAKRRGDARQALSRHIRGQLPIAKKAMETLVASMNRAERTS